MEHKFLNLYPIAHLPLIQLPLWPPQGERKEIAIQKQSGLEYRGTIKHPQWDVSEDLPPLKTQPLCGLEIIPGCST